MRWPSAHPPEEKYKAFTLHFLYIGVDATDPIENEKKGKKLLAYVAAARELLQSDYAVQTEADDIWKYYRGVKYKLSNERYPKWDSSDVGIAIAEHVKEEHVFTAMTTFEPNKIGNVSTETQKLVAEAAEIAGRTGATSAVREAWSGRVSPKKGSSEEIVDPDLHARPHAKQESQADADDRVADEFHRIYRDGQQDLTYYSALGW